MKQKVDKLKHSKAIYSMESEDEDSNSNLNNVMLTSSPISRTAVSKSIIVSLDGIQSGVPTLTTPTLTPTTMRSIQETFIQLTDDQPTPYQAGFIPPPLSSTNMSQNTSIMDNNTDYNEGNDSDSDNDNSQASWNDAQGNDDLSSATTDTSSVAADSTSFQGGLNGYGNNSMGTNDFSSVNVGLTGSIHAFNTSNSAKNNSLTTTTRRNQGGRRPAKTANMSPEEEEKRRVRRERNKLAAARCRKRRVDQTNELLEEVAILEGKRENFQKDIESLNSSKQNLQRILEMHRCQKIGKEHMTVATYGGIIAPHNDMIINRNITGIETTLSSLGRSGSPIDLKPVIHNEQIIEMVPHIKNEPLESALDSGSSLDHEGPSSPKRILLSNGNPMIPTPLPAASTLSPSLAAASVSLNTPIVTTAPVDFSNFDSANSTLNTLNTLNAMQRQGIRQRPNTLPNVPRNFAQNLSLHVDGKPHENIINGVPIQTPSTGMFNFDSLMDGGTGLTPVSGPLVPTCSSQNKHPLELTTPTSEPSKLVSL